MRWQVTTKADDRPRKCVDGLSPGSNGKPHYSRQTPGHPMWTRPGWTQILYAEQRNGRAAAFCWWRPKWEAGIPGTERKDGLRCIECTLFRNETRFRSSDLIRDAVTMVMDWEHANNVDWPDGLISGVNSKATAGGRQPDSLPGKCFLEAGWEYANDIGGKRKRADTWLRLYPRQIAKAACPPQWPQLERW